MAINVSSPPAGADPSVDPGSPLSFGLLIHQVRETLARQIETGLERSRLDLNFNQFRVLKVLLEGHARTPGEIARLLRHDAGAMTRLIDRLVERGCLVREHCASDRRQTFLVLTEEGRRLGQRMVEVASLAVAETLAPLSPAEQLQLMDLLTRIRQTVDQTADAPLPTRQEPPT